MQSPHFWQDVEKVKEITQQVSMLKGKLEDVLDMERKVEDLEVCIELADGDQELQEEFERESEKIRNKLDQMELMTLLGETYDNYNAIFSVHSGAGGIESQDWAEMLLRMYMKWAEKKGYQVQVVDVMPGEEAGIKSASLLIKGLYAYGYLKGERGVHRLVRISPFDANHRRHTSFASVDVIPELDDEIEIEIRDEDIRVDTFRASGAGGQYVNKTDSAVRITHIPTGLVVQCQNERSQYYNKVTALKILKSRLFVREMEAQQKKVEQLSGEKKEIAWGSQIRSYIFHPYSLVKDLRTDTQTSNIQAVMDGEIDEFIKNYLMEYRKSKNR